MYRLKVKKDSKVYIKKFASMQEVFSEMHSVLFGYPACRMSLAELQFNAEWQDIRFYVSFCKD